MLITVGWCYELRKTHPQKMFVRKPLIFKAVLRLEKIISKFLLKNSYQTSVHSSGVTTVYVLTKLRTSTQF